MRTQSLALLAASLVLFLGLSAAVADSPDKPGTHEGILVKVLDRQLTMTDKDGKNEHSHEVAPDARISCDGKECKLDELQKGCTLRVALEKRDNRMMATKVEAKKPA